MLLPLCALWKWGGDAEPCMKGSSSLSAAFKLYCPSLKMATGDFVQTFKYQFFYVVFCIYLPNFLLRESVAWEDVSMFFSCLIFSPIFSCVWHSSHIEWTGYNQNETTGAYCDDCDGSTFESEGWRPRGVGLCPCHSDTTQVGWNDSYMKGTTSATSELALSEFVGFASCNIYFILATQQ